MKNAALITLFAIYILTACNNNSVHPKSQDPQLPFIGFWSAYKFLYTDTSTNCNYIDQINTMGLGPDDCYVKGESRLYLRNDSSFWLDLRYSHIYDMGCSCKSSIEDTIIGYYTYIKTSYTDNFGNKQDDYKISFYPVNHQLVNSTVNFDGIWFVDFYVKGGYFSAQYFKN